LGEANTNYWGQAVRKGALGPYYAAYVAAINYISTVLQTRKTTIDAEVANLSSFLRDFKTNTGSWEAILNECKVVAKNLSMQTEFMVLRQEMENMTN
jgi:hypothetical protein